MSNGKRLAAKLKSRREEEMPVLDLPQVRELVDEMFGDSLHAMRALSLANGVAGVLTAAVMSIHAIGQAYAKLALIQPRSGVKQADRLLSNSGVKLEDVLPSGSGSWSRSAGRSWSRWTGRTSMTTTTRPWW